MKLPVNASVKGDQLICDGFADSAESAVAMAVGAGRDATEAFKQDFDLDMVGSEDEIALGQQQWQARLHGQQPDRRSSLGGWGLFAVGWVTY
ncbi:hypothetical protein Mmc1_3120 [Magnetococcus marinus MC-1]|uniref:Uncharacterized protein n=1 Tax=Magnetococcus marinus (strain ATCC BAA-1437 / JCM 17883 / MC-1) TaxID=156889 RepID=A0LCB7_MAGMM|nr:hypothetical protein [Magnetococcus marinus]ABK45610.1 hypothetical protein Mmc1_3120 [Magnetococcus marinus MC-1]